MSNQRVRASRVTQTLFFVIGLFSSDESAAKFEVTEGKGYILCERLALHVNRLTENGKAKRLWWFHWNDSNAKPYQVVRYPEAQSHLTRELLSFPGFTRPTFTELKLEDIRGLIELMGEVDVLAQLGRPHYLSFDNDLARYVADRKTGQVPADVLDKLRPQGQWLYERLLKGKARVFRLGEDLALAPETLLQIEYNHEATGEPAALLRHVSNDLTEPRQRASTLDSRFTSRALVKWNRGYYRVHSGAGGFEIEGRTSGSYPRLCQVNNPYRPPEAPSTYQRN